MTTDERAELVRLRNKVKELERKEIETDLAPALARWKQTQAEKEWK